MFYVAVSNFVADVCLWRLAFKCMKVVVRWQPATSCVLASDHFMESVGNIAHFTFVPGQPLKGILHTKTDFASNLTFWTVISGV